MSGKTFRCQYVKCGKSACRSCPHGPYWYAFWKENGRTKSEYHGKVDPRPGPPPGPQPRPQDRIIPSTWDGIFNAKTANVDLALEILGLFRSCTETEAEQKFRKLMRANHPDAGGDTLKCQQINAAYSFLKSRDYWR